MHFIMYFARELSFHGIMICLSRDLHPITVRMEVMIVDFVESSFMDGKVILKGFICL